MLNTIYDLLGNGSVIQALLNWLREWPGSGPRAALLSGPCGVGKTASAHLACAHLEMRAIEINAGDVTTPSSLSKFFLTSAIGIDGRRHCLIVDDVDCMDRGGLPDLVKFIKRAHIPVICICSERFDPSLKPLANLCIDLRFVKLEATNIRRVINATAKKIPSAVIKSIIAAADGDARQATLLAQLAKGCQEQDGQIYGLCSAPVQNIFEATRQLFTNGATSREQNWTDMIAFMVQENCLERASNIEVGLQLADLFCLADCLSTFIRTGWGTSAMVDMQRQFAIKLPSQLVAKPAAGRSSGISFPTSLGKLSTWNKHKRILQALNLEFDDAFILREAVESGLEKGNTDGAVLLMKTAKLNRADWDNLVSVTQMRTPKIARATKSAFTKQLNIAMPPKKNATPQDATVQAEEPDDA